MGDLVAKVGGLFAEVNESLRAVREVLPSALIKANKYYTAIAEITRTVWDDLKAVDVNSEEKDKCESEALKGVTELPTACGDQACPLREGLNESTLKKYKSGCLEVNVMTQSGKVSTCFNLPRNNLYMSSAVEGANGEVQWVKSTPNEFQFILEVQKIFTPLIGPFGAGQLPSVLLATLSNITFFRSRFDEVHSSFTSLLLGTNLTDNLNGTDFAI
ncbi:ESAG protein, putative [Trypanosoma equiperdum]|uniref:ESAG protein, putative n=1 Tax=Trypanosoma equiperdum TaxID=5694 RepID=A0A1G4IIY6_TRYEQ|nr:ESAG protein, putative [Trypanosoma equiperdum]